MPVDRQTFETVRQRVIETAPAGLSREQFDALLDQELAKVEAPAQPSAPPADSRSRIMGQLDQMEARGGELRQEAVEHPISTAANIALAGVTPVAGRAVATAAKAAQPLVWPTRAAAGRKFEQVMSKAADVPVDTSGAERVAARIWELAGRGGSMPKPVNDFIKRMADPGKGPMLYREARDFASNLGRLSAREWSRINPVIGNEVHKLYFALKTASGKAAGAVGQGQTYKAAMSEYARAARRAELAKKVVKEGARYAIPGGLAYGGYKVLND